MSSLVNILAGAWDLTASQSSASVCSPKTSRNRVATATYVKRSASLRKDAVSSRLPGQWTSRDLITPHIFRFPNVIRKTQFVASAVFAIAVFSAIASGGGVSISLPPHLTLDTQGMERSRVLGGPSSNQGGAQRHG